MYLTFSARDVVAPERVFQYREQLHGEISPHELQDTNTLGAITKTSENDTMAKLRTETHQPSIIIILLLFPQYSCRKQRGRGNGEMQGTTITK